CYNIHEESPFFVLFFATEIITFPLKGRLSSFIVSGKFPYRVKFYTKGTVIPNASKNPGTHRWKL
ncbi:hypothetical protein, partial [Dialister succinatiphilus]|uniref:hypothetical protein n=1 Tax=Dialister succinatiphilus TaxID=487173 RepID=UPI003AEF4286